MRGPIINAIALAATQSRQEKEREKKNGRKIPNV